MTPPSDECVRYVHHVIARGFLNGETFLTVSDIFDALPNFERDDVVRAMFVMLEKNAIVWTKAGWMATGFHWPVDKEWSEL